MPARNSIKAYVVGGIYHIYNRGVEKRSVFLQDADYKLFNRLLYKGSLRKQNSLAEAKYNTEIIQSCLMPNHFHLLVRQQDSRDIEKLMRCVMSAYVGYFNRKYDRVGSLFQGPYKAVLMLSDQQLKTTMNYIRENPAGAGLVMSGEEYRYYQETPVAGVSLLKT